MNPQYVRSILISLQSTVASITRKQSSCYYQIVHPDVNKMTDREVIKNIDNILKMLKEQKY